MIDSSSTESSHCSAVTNEKNLILSTNRLAHSLFSLVNDLDKQVSQLLSSCENFIVALKSGHHLSLLALFDPLSEDLLKRRNEVCILYWIAQLQVAFLEARLKLKHAQKVKTIVIEQRVVNRFETKAFDDFLLVLLFQLGHCYRYTSIS